MVEIIIGREAGVEKPRLALTADGKTSYYGTPGSVPRCVSRKHCRLEIHEDSTLSISDMTDNNLMYVNGSDCKSRGHITLNDTVELGSERYRLELPAIVKLFSAQQTYHIASLKTVYDDYYKIKLDNQIRQGKLNALSALPGVLSMSSMVLAICLNNEGVRIVMIVLAALFAVGVVIIRMKNSSNNPLKMKELDDAYHDSYVCPNPSCQHFLGAMQYKDLLKNGACPYCKAKYVE